MKFLPKHDLLTLEELARVCTAFIEKGVKKIRITGGEPLVRRDIMQLFQNLSRHLKTEALQELTLTTNGSQLARFAGELYDCGVRRINVSIDTLNRDKFKAITRWGDLSKVMDGLEVARRLGFKIKINTVALKGFNDLEIDDLIRFAHGHGFDLTLIETMPMGDIAGHRADQYLPLSTVQADLRSRWTFEDSSHRTGGPARYVKVRETGGRLGFITPLTHNFCESCNRVRLTCTGRLYMCLGQNDAADLRTPLRTSANQEALYAAIDNAIARKPEGHDSVIDRRSNKAAV